MSNTSTRGASATSTKTTTADEMKVVHTFVKNSFDEVWTYLQPFKGKLRAHVRIFTTGDDDDDAPDQEGNQRQVRTTSRSWQKRSPHLLAAVKEQDVMTTDSKARRAVAEAAARGHRAGSSLGA